MKINASVKRNWTEIQKKFDYPVNAIGVKIKENDTKTLSIWKEEGIDRFMKQ